MLCGIADQNCIAVHCGCGASILKDLDSIERRALPSPTCSPGQGGFPKGDAARLRNETGRRAKPSSVPKPQEVFSCLHHAWPIVTCAPFLW